MPNAARHIIAQINLRLTGTKVFTNGAVSMQCAKE